MKLIYPTREDFVERLRSHTSAEVACYFNMSRRTVHRLIKRWNIPDVYTRKNYPIELSKLQSDIITGNLLGDGSIGHIKLKRDKNAVFTFSQEKSKLDYVTYIHDILCPLSKGIRLRSHPKPKRIGNTVVHTDSNGYCYAYEFCTARSPIFSALRNKWYIEPHTPRSRKIVPKDIQLNWQTVAIWMCDDGHNNVSAKSIKLSTECFLKDDVNFLIDKLKQLGISDVWSYCCYGKHAIYIGSGSYIYFIENIKPFIHFPSMYYKVEETNVNI